MSNSKPTVSRKAIFTLAWELKKAGLFTTLSDALKCAWSQAKETAMEVIEFYSKKAQGFTKRIVTKDWSKFYTPKGTGRPKPAKLTLFADLLKVCKGIANPVISCYSYTTL